MKRLVQIVLLLALLACFVPAQATDLTITFVGQGPRGDSGTEINAVGYLLSALITLAVCWFPIRFIRRRMIRAPLCAGTLIFLSCIVPAWATVYYFNNGAINGVGVSTTDAVAALPGSTMINDIMVVSCFSRTTTDTTTVTGYTALGTELVTSTGSHTWFWKRHDGSEATADCVSDSNADHSAIMFVFRNAEQSGDPFAAVGTPEEDAPAATFTVAAITTTAVNQMVIVLSNYEDDDLASFAVTSTDPATYTEDYNEVTTSTSDSALSAAYERRATAGSTGTITLDYSGDGTDQFATLAVVLDPHTCAGPCVVQVAATRSFANANTVAVTLPLATDTGNVLVVGCMNTNSVTTASVTDGTNTYTQRSGSAQAQSNLRTDVWEDFVSGSGATAVTCTFNGSAGTYAKGIVVWEVSGCTSCEDDTENTAGGSGTTFTGGSVTTTSAEGFIAGVIQADNGVANNPSAGNEFTSGGAIGTSMGGASLESTTAAAHNPAWDGTSANWSSSTVAYKKAAAGAVVPYLPMRGVG
jgi:hypothetical protein